jgi:hypothetical protein
LGILAAVTEGRHRDIAKGFVRFALSDIVLMGLFLNALGNQIKRARQAGPDERS